MTLIQIPEKQFIATKSELLAILNAGRALLNATKNGVTFNFPANWNQSAKCTFRDMLGNAAKANASIFERSGLVVEPDVTINIGCLSMTFVDDGMVPSYLDAPLEPDEEL